MAIPRNHTTAQKGVRKRPRRRGIAANLSSSSRIGQGRDGPSSVPDQKLIAPRKIEPRAVESLRAAPRNPRNHSARQVRQIAESIRRFGFVNPILIDESGGVLAGHGRLAAARLLGLTEVPVIRLDHMSAVEKRAYVLADNRLAELAGWDEALLALELSELSGLDLEFDLTVTGFAVAEIDLLIEGAPNSDPAADAVRPLDLETPPVSRLGDLWQLGPHRLLCGDARDEAAVARLMDGRLAQMVFADPPYNVPIHGHVSGLGRHRHPEFAMACGEMSELEFTEFLAQSLTGLAQHSQDGAIHFICMDWRHLLSLLTAGRKIYAELKNLCVWAKTNAGMGSLYRSQHELIAVFKHGTGPHINNVELGRHGRYRTNLWTYAGANTLRAERNEALSMHPTVKPAGLVADAIRDCSRRNGRVLDGFAGSGTTLVAAEVTGRRAHALEIDPRYVDVAIKRWQAFSGDAAVHLDTGFGFEELSAQRRTGAPSGPNRKGGSRRGETTHGR